MWTLSLLLACTGIAPTGDSGTTDTADSADAGIYAFTSALTGTDSVSYGGQVFRQLLIDDMKVFLGGLTDSINDGSRFPAEGDVARDLLFYLEFDSSTSGGVALGTETDPATLQATYDDVSSGKNLVEKLAGNDATGQHKDWDKDFVGWQADGVTSPESLVRHWIATLDAQAVDWGTGELPIDPLEQPVPAVHVTPEGQDLRQLLQKFLRGAIAYSQGADDYLDADIDGKGLLQAHDVVEEGKPYTALEHAWDEGFGYFGAARASGDWADADLADQPYQDTDGDGAIDLQSELSWGHAVNAGKRDAGAVAATDFTAQAWAGFHGGRALLADTAGRALTADEFDTLLGHRDQALSAWEAAIAATVVHYINDLLQDLDAVGTADFSFGDYAKHWSELKGFALSLQFNPTSSLSDAEFLLLQDAIGTQPVSPAADTAALEGWAETLREARTLVGDAHGFDPANLGDSGGESGW